MEAVKLALIIAGAYTAVSVTLSIFQWSRDRAGGSGRFGHWWDGKEHD